MTSIFQRKVKKNGRCLDQPAEGRITLAAFGKHPGWDDHIPGIGVETETLAYLKQALYVSGIGGQIDSGAWEKLEEGKRLDGFDHMFLWLNAGHVVLGQLWSSMDRQARSKYPMVLCVEGEKLTPASLLSEPRLELDRLRAACKATNSADHVAFECRTAQDRLRAWLGRSSTELAKSQSTLEMKRRFLQRHEFGPDSLGLLRVMHELDNATGRTHHRLPEPGAAADLRPYHIRVPLCADSQTEGLSLWAGFLISALSDSVPLLLIGRTGTNWLDVIIGQPGGEDLFCLQASLKALPLASEIPYEVAPELKPRLRELEATFFGAEPPVSGGEKSSASATLPPPIPATDSMRTMGTSALRRSRLMGFAVTVGVLALFVFGWWLIPETRRAALAEREKGFQAALTDGRAALGRSNYLVAVKAAERALGLKRNDAAALSLKNQAEAQQSALANLEQSFKTAMDAAQGALRQKDYPRANAEANRALALKPNDAGALRLKTEAETQHGVEAKQGQDFKMAMERAQAALRQKEYAKAIVEADRALGLKPADAEAAKLKASAQLQAGVIVKLEEDFKTAVRDTQAALQQQEYAKAIAEASRALALKPADPEALRLKAAAESQHGVQAKLEQDFKTAIERAQAALRQKEYAKAIVEADRALGLMPADAEAAKLKANAQLQAGVLVKLEQDFKIAMDGAQVALQQNDYGKAITSASRALELKPNDEGAMQLKADAQMQQGVEAKLEQDFNTAMRDALLALQQKEYLNAIVEANRALAFKPADAEAMKLKANAETLQRAAEGLEQDFNGAISGARMALLQKDYVKAIAEANRALGLKPNDSEAKKLQTDAQKEQEPLANLNQDYQKADTSFKEGNYEQTLKLCDAHREVDRFDKLSQQVREEQEQLKTLTVAVNKGQYDVALQANLPDKPPFRRLKEQATGENSALLDANQKLAGGEYAFIEALESQGYETKPRFMPVLEVARKERKELITLQAQQKANQRQAVRENVAKLTEELRSKRPFADLAKWASQVTVDSPRPKSPALAGVLTQFDNILEVYEVTFGVKPAEARIVRADGTIAKLWPPRKPLDSALYAGEVDKLRSRYQSMQELDAQREARLMKLRAAILNWKQ